MMYRIVAFIGIMILTSCKPYKKEVIAAQAIIDKSIEVSGGKLYRTTIRSFTFRDKKYISENRNDKQVLKRITENDSATIIDVRTNSKFERFVNDSLVQIQDSMAIKYANSVNSVHYFASLPAGLNDAAVKKEYLGEMSIHEKQYFKVKVTFSQDGGGDDFDDIYIYWFNKETWKPDYLAYEFHVDGGGMRFREAYNERYVNGIRFVDYNNYKPEGKQTTIFGIDSLFVAGNLKMVSKIELKNIQVSQGNYN